MHLASLAALHFCPTTNTYPNVTSRVRLLRRPACVLVYSQWSKWLITLSCRLITSLSETNCENYLGMMSSQGNVVTHYALLIGIDAYPELSLDSCVRDFQNITNYLRGVLNSVHIQVLTATKSADSESRSPTEEPSLWPTYQNVTSAFEKITVQAIAGDFVYIRYFRTRNSNPMGAIQ
jgi:hypothetical protein